MMRSDRYLKAILTIIALELGWMAFNQAATPVTAQAAPTQVVITGVEVGNARGYLPVGVLGQPRTTRADFVPVAATVSNARLPVSVEEPVTVQTVGVVKIEADKPLKVENVGYTPSQRPGE